MWLLTHAESTNVFADFPMSANRPNRMDAVVCTHVRNIPLLDTECIWIWARNNIWNGNLDQQQPMAASQGEFSKLLHFTAVAS